MSELVLWSKHIRIFKIAFGIYLAFHFLDLYDWTYEMFGHQQMLDSLSLNGTAKIFPNIIALFNTSPMTLKIYTLSLIVCSLMIATNRFITFASLYVWYGWACFFNANNLILNPGLPYVGWLLLTLSLLGSKQQSKRRDDLVLLAWTILAVGYSISGIAKALSPSWQDGSALIKVFSNPLARDYFLRDFADQIPHWILRINTWFVLALEILFVPLCFFQITRKWAWILMTSLHLGILVFINFTDLTLGMIMIHLFVFDYNWFPQIKDFVLEKVNYPEV